MSIGIVMILIGLALPTMNSARRAAQQVSQLKSIQQAGDLLAMFADSNDGQYPLFGDNQYDAISGWYEPLLRDEYLDSVDVLDPKSAKMGLSMPFAMSGSLCSAADYYVPEAKPYPDETLRPVSPVRVDQVVHPSSKGALLTWRIGYPVDVIHVAWCCIDLSLQAPIGFADGSAESLAVDECFVSSPIRIQELAGVPVYTTWHGARGRDR